MLYRPLTDHKIYPLINILNSASRTICDIATPRHRADSRKFKHTYSMLKKNEVLIQSVRIKNGSDKELDFAMSKKDFIHDFIRQDAAHKYKLEYTINVLKWITSILV